MSVKNWLYSFSENFFGSSLEDKRDLILEGRDAFKVAEDHPSDLADAFFNRAKKEINEVETQTNKLKDKVEITEENLDELGRKEVENPDYPEYISALGKAEKRLESARELEVNSEKELEDAKKFLIAIEKISENDEAQVSSSKAEEKKNEIKNLQNRVENNYSKVSEHEALIDNMKNQLESAASSGDKGVEEQRRAVKEVASTIHRRLDV
jgi:chromosome segregation ATPase